MYHSMEVALHLVEEIKKYILMWHQRHLSHHFTLVDLDVSSAKCFNVHLTCSVSVKISFVLL